MELWDPGSYIHMNAKKGVFPQHFQSAHLGNAARGTYLNKAADSEASDTTPAHVHEAFGK